MAAINVKISDDMKDLSDSVLREHGLNAMQYITLCWQYLSRHDKQPFITQTRVMPPRPAAPGDWFVRSNARTAAAEKRLDKLPLTLPPISGTDILACSVYGRIARSQLAGASNNGFTLLNSYSEFYLSRDNSPDADVNVPVSELAAGLAAVVDAAFLWETGHE